MSRKSYSLFVVVIVVAALALSQLACSGSGGGGDTNTPSGCQPGMAQTVDGKSCVAPTQYNFVVWAERKAPKCPRLMSRTQESEDNKKARE